MLLQKAVLFLAVKPETLSTSLGMPLFQTPWFALAAWLAVGVGRMA